MLGPPRGGLALLQGTRKGSMGQGNPPAVPSAGGQGVRPQWESILLDYCILTAIADVGVHGTVTETRNLRILTEIRGGGGGGGPPPPPGGGGGGGGGPPPSPVSANSGGDLRQGSSGYRGFPIGDSL